jgi:hypothetical protein
MDGTLPAWKGRKIAEQTIPLKPEVAAAVDANLAPFAGRMTITRITRAVEAAILRHDPELAAERQAVAKGVVAPGSRTTSTPSRPAEWRSRPRRPRRRRCPPAWTEAVVVSAPARKQRSSAGSPTPCPAQR